MGNASFSEGHDYIDLTPDPTATVNVSSSNETAPNVALQNCIGRVLYRQQLTMWPASFTTTFTIFVKNITTVTNFNGDGIAFIIASNNRSFLPKSYGAFLGLFDSSTNGNTTDQLAIEFDTFQNEFDPDNNHVGIDIQGIISNVTAGMGDHGMDIKAGRAINVRVNYDGWAKSLQIYTRYANSGSAYASLLNSTVELENTVPRSAYVGFSAATGNSYEIHRILDWNFSSVMLPESSLILLPAVTGTHQGSGGGVKLGILVGSITVGLVLVGLLALWQALQVLINPNEELPQLPSTRPLAIYVVLPPVGAVFSESTLFSNMGGGPASSSLIVESSTGSITTSTLRDGR
ncbi:hypothetical protein SUGI_0644490 [Cryptomeria japonica]|nr:hypothetical protein SUGI_0644490 [Cryptomeria japonica]